MPVGLTFQAVGGGLLFGGFEVFRCFFEVY